MSNPGEDEEKMKPVGVINSPRTAPPLNPTAADEVCIRILESLSVSATPALS